MPEALTRIPTHAAIIVDGNRRWAKNRGLPASFGHKAGFDRLKEITRYAVGDCGIKVLWDERRTTVTAAGILSANSTFGADRKARLDSVSAAVILESFLAWRKAHPGEEPPEVAAPTAPEQA